MRAAERFDTKFRPVDIVGLPYYIDNVNVEVIDVVRVISLYIRGVCALGWIGFSLLCVNH